MSENNVVKEAMNHVKGLVAKREIIEKEMREINNFLESSGFGLKGNLIDKQGFPISDVEKILAVRDARSKFIHLQTDHKEIMKSIDVGLQEMHRIAKEEKLKEPVLEEEVKPQQQLENSEVEAQPFARVDEVFNDSPAQQAGLKIEDLILQFGSLTQKNFPGLKAIGELVMNSEGRQITVKVRRSEGGNIVTHTIHVTPKKWSGRGLLGCHFVPV